MNFNFCCLIGLGAYRSSLGRQGAEQFVPTEAPHHGPGAATRRRGGTGGSNRGPAATTTAPPPLRKFDKGIGDRRDCTEPAMPPPLLVRARVGEGGFRSGHYRRFCTVRDRNLRFSKSTSNFDNEFFVMVCDHAHTIFRRRCIFLIFHKVEKIFRALFAAPVFLRSIFNMDLSTFF